MDGMMLFRMVRALERIADVLERKECRERDKEV